MVDLCVFGCGLVIAGLMVNALSCVSWAQVMMMGGVGNLL